MAMAPFRQSRTLPPERLRTPWRSPISPRTASRISPWPTPTATTVSVLLGNGDGTFAAKQDFGTGSAPKSIAVADLNGDGKLDLVSTNFTGNGVTVLLGNGDGTFAAQSNFATPLKPRSVAVADLNGD